MSTHDTPFRHFSSERDRLADMMWLLFSLANLTLILSVPGQRISAQLYWMLHRSENAALSIVQGAEFADDLSLVPKGAGPMPLPGEIEREARMLYLAQSLQQCAMALAVYLAAFPRALRNRDRASSLRGGHSLSSLRGGAAEPGIQGWEGNGLAPAPMKPNLSRALRHYISGTRIKSGMTASSAARGPP